MCLALLLSVMLASHRKFWGALSTFEWGNRKLTSWWIPSRPFSLIMLAKNCPIYQRTHSFKICFFLGLTKLAPNLGDCTSILSTVCFNHIYRKAKIDRLSFVYVPATSAAHNRLLFFFFLLRPFTVLMKKTRAVKQSIFLRCLWFQQNKNVWPFKVYSCVRF